jgi:hypothetical protein
MKKMTALTGLAFSLLLSGCTSQKSNPANGDLIMPPMQFASSSSEAPVQLLPVTMKIHTSAVFGFSFRYPDRILVYEGMCGKRHAQIETKIIEDTEHAIVYFTPARFNEVPWDSPECEMIETTIPLIERKARYESWKIHVLKEIHSEQELLREIQAAYGSECILDERTQDVNPGIVRFRVRPASDKNLEPYDARCPVHSAIEVKYDAKRARAAYWDLGQESKFWTDTEATTSYDQEMLESVRFF